MKFIISFIIFLSFTSSIQSQKIDTTTTFEWDSTTYLFNKNAQQVFTYNGACYLTRYVYSFWDSASASYIKYYRTTNSLLGNNATSQSLTQLWDDVAKKWDNYQKGFYTYTTSPKLPSSVLYQDYQTSNSSWLNSRLYTYTYDANGNNTTILIQEWKSSSWSNLFQNQYTFNANNLMTSFIQLTWNATNNVWANFNKIDYSYLSNNKLLQDSGKKWSAITSNWINTYSSQYFYDSNNFLKTWEYNAWDTTAANFIKSQQYQYTNNANGDAIEILTLNWNGATWDTVFNDVNHYNACVLPVSLISFNLKKENLKVNINWQTGEEINTAYFNVQRSVKSNFNNTLDNFTTIGKLDANNTASYYLYKDDISSLTGSKGLLYRLEIVDKNGSKTYSNIKEVFLDYNEKTVAIFPNPASDYLNIKSSKIKQIQIKDIAGRVLLKQLFDNTNSVINLPVKSLAKGIVFLEVTNADMKISTQKVLIQ
jgi:hypothetical protein